MTGFFHFYDCGVCVGVLQQPVSMPYDGLISFLLDNLEEECDGGQVSIPYDGLISFLRRMYQKFSGAYLVVSMPYDGLFSFLHCTLDNADMRSTNLVSMPYDGLFSFLLIAADGRVRSFLRCQCPMTGFFHFYLTAEIAYTVERDQCQCPMTGFFHFYPDQLLLDIAEEGVNAL